MRARLLLLCVLSGALCGCSHKPSAADGRRKLENQIHQQSNGLVKLVSFEKTDGSMQEMMGMKTYAMSYAAEIEFVEDCLWSGGNNLTGWDGSFRAQRGQAPQDGGLMDVFYKTQGVKPAKKGERFKFTGSMDFEKTERGWH